MFLKGNLFSSKTVGLLLGLFLLACGNYADTQLPSPEDVPTMKEEKQNTLALGFSDVEEAVFSKYCTECHKEYSNYNAVRADLTNIYNAVNTNRMPKNASPLSTGLKNLLKKWIDQGAPEVAQEETDKEKKEGGTLPTLNRFL